MQLKPTRSPILHVENDAVVARSVARVLRHRGLAVERVAGCRDARRVGQSYAIGIFDIDLDDGNGLALAEELTHRGLVRRAIFFTANTDVDMYSVASSFGLVVSKAQGASALLAALYGQDGRDGDEHCAGDEPSGCPADEPDMPGTR